MAKIRKSPSYLLRVGTAYHFRYVVPRRYSRFISGEVRLSLGTSSLKQARIKAAKLIVFSQKYLIALAAGGYAMIESKEEIKLALGRFLRQMLEENELGRLEGPAKSLDTNVPSLKVKPATILGLINIDVTQQLIGNRGKYRVNVHEFLEKVGLVGISEQSDTFKFVHRELLKVYQALLNIEKERLQGNYNGYLEHSILSNYPVPHQFEQAKIKGQKEKASKRLSKAIEQFIKENVGDGVWAPRSLIDYKNRLALLQAVMGDCFLSEIDHDKIRDFFDKIKRLPPNRTKIKAYKGKCVTELLKMNLSPDKCMTGQTINNVMATVSGFFQWATNRDLLKKNYAAGFSVKQTRRPDESRESFKADELKKLFLVITKRDANYWIPLIGLFSGARLEEICQLHISDIRQEKGVWIFDVNNEGEKRLKTPSSKRIVPIHTALIEKGLIEYVKEIKSKGHQRLFPFLKQVKGKYGHYQSRQFSEQLKKLGIKQSGRNISFHSLRHTFLTAAKFADLPISYIQEMVGHSSGSLTYGTYGKRYDVQKLKEIIDQIRFELD